MVLPVEKATTLFPDYIAEAIQLCEKLPLSEVKVNKIVVLGMGGSAIGADILAAVAEKVASVPVLVIRNEEIPNYVDENTFVIAVSYSGNTQETLTALKSAAARKPKQIVAISTGGLLENLSALEKFPLIKVPDGLAPRAALPYSLVPLFLTLQKTVHFPDMHDALTESIHVLKTLRDELISDKRIAQGLHGKIPIIYASTPFFMPAARRWKCQFNENAKQLAYFESLPEADHNEIVGYTKKLPLHQNMAVVILNDSTSSEITQRRLIFFKNAIIKCGCPVYEAQSKGENLLTKLLSLCYTGDLVSLHLAELNGVDPTPVQIIDTLKQEFQKQDSSLRSPAPTGRGPE